MESHWLVKLQHNLRIHEVKVQEKCINIRIRVFCVLEFELVQARLLVNCMCRNNLPFIFYTKHITGLIIFENKDPDLGDHAPLLSLVVLTVSLVPSMCRSTVPGSDWEENWWFVWSSERFLPERRHRKCQYLSTVLPFPSRPNVYYRAEAHVVYISVASIWSHKGQTVRCFAQINNSNRQHYSAHLYSVWCSWWCWWKEWRTQVGAEYSGGSYEDFAPPSDPGPGEAAGWGSWSQHPFLRSVHKECGSCDKTEPQKSQKTDSNIYLKSKNSLMISTVSTCSPFPDFCNQQLAALR